MLAANSAKHRTSGAGARVPSPTPERREHRRLDRGGFGHVPFVAGALFVTAPLTTQCLVRQYRPNQSLSGA